MVEEREGQGRLGSDQPEDSETAKILCYILLLWKLKYSVPEVWGCDVSSPYGKARPVSFSTKGTQQIYLNKKKYKFKQSNNHDQAIVHFLPIHIPSTAMEKPRPAIEPAVYLARKN